MSDVVLKRLKVNPRDHDQVGATRPCKAAQDLDAASDHLAEISWVYIVLGERHVEGVVGLQASLDWRMDFDLSQYWNWNTKIIFAYVQAEYESKLNGINQASLFDVIITKKRRTKFKGRAKQEYEFMDQGKHMRGMQFNMTLTWCIMPRVGTLTGLRHAAVSSMLVECR